MQHGAILNIGVFTYGNECVIASDHRVEPDAGVVLKPNLAHDRRIFGNEVVLP